MEAGVVVIVRYLIEPHRYVRPRSDPLAGVDRAGFKRRHDVASRSEHDGGTHAAQHLAAKPRHAIPQDLEIRGTVDLLVEPAAHLHALVEAR